MLSFTPKYFYTASHLASLRSSSPKPIAFKSQLIFLKHRVSLTKMLSNRSCKGSHFNKHYIALQSWYVSLQRSTYTKLGSKKKIFFLFSQPSASGFIEAYKQLPIMSNLEAALLWKAKQIESIFNIKIASKKKKKRIFFNEVVYYLHPSRRINFCWHWLSLFIKTLYTSGVKKKYSFTPALENFLLAPNKTNTIYCFKQKTYRLFAVRSS